ncbi:hypothetical protein [Chromobacterium haemolyticum]|uniref:hypothetical protein n=1 Tax=Chromobacterium haemolyticum TaxID=394935 RepID=UPI002954818F|nr:hypothetical protein [Chromobacterium haemolyticum]WON82126.1 hypothetical protein OK026_13280 [Chromobacterium haemolyticum]
MQKVFIVMCQLGGVIDSTLLGIISTECQVRKETWLVAFDETRYGETHYYSSEVEIIIDEGAKKFIQSRYGSLDKSRKQFIDTISRKCRDTYNNYLTAKRTEVRDRVEKAFTNPIARQAKLTADRGNYERAEELYDQAILADHNNPYLLDRFAWFLLIKTKIYPNQKL